MPASRNFVKMSKYSSLRSTRGFCTWVMVQTRNTKSSVLAPKPWKMTLGAGGKYSWDYEPSLAGAGKSATAMDYSDKGSATC